jgi:hypothetical protein
MSPRGDARTRTLDLERPLGLAAAGAGRATWRSSAPDWAWCPADRAEHGKHRVYQVFAKTATSSILLWILLGGIGSLRSR